MPFFFVEREGGRAAVKGADARHLARSLRARVGEKIEVVDPAAAKLLTVQLDVVTTDRVEGVVLSERDHRPEPARHVVVGISHVPSSTLEVVLSRCTEAGAGAFHIVQADRSVARGARTERWETIIREAAMLAGRLRVPIVAGPSPLRDVIGERPNPVLLARDSPIALAALPLPAQVTVLVGPEGGWTDRELAMVPAHAGLGPRNLRVDTAAIIATAIAAGL